MTPRPATSPAEPFPPVTVVNVGYRSTNYWVVSAGTSRLLVDLGWPGTLGTMRATLARMDIPLHEIRYAVATHFHIDHAGLAEELKREGVPLVVLEGQEEALSGMTAWTKPEDHYVPITREGNVALAFAESREFLAALGIPGEILPTPGHSGHCVSLLLDGGTVFTGDLPLEEHSYDNPVALASWRLLRSRGARSIHPGHGGVRSIGAAPGKAEPLRPAGPPMLRLATRAEIPALLTLIPRSARGLSGEWYTAGQVESLIEHVFGPDTQLIEDGTYWVAEEEGKVVGCGGWSRRRTLYGGDQMKNALDPLLDPASDAARIRAFFVDPAWARRGIGAAILEACMDSARAAGFRRAELMATLPGIPFYRHFGFDEIERVQVTLPDGVGVAFARMTRELIPA